MKNYKPKNKRKYGSGWKFNFKKLLLALLIMLCFSGFAFAENIVILSHTQAESGQIATIEVDINNDDPFVAFQLDLELNSQLTYASNSASLNPDRENGHSLYSGIINNNVLRIIVFSLTNTPFNGNSGTVLTFELETGSVPGLYPLEPFNVVMTYTDLVNIVTDVQNGSVTILAPDIVTNLQQISFGEIPLGQHIDKPLIIYNAGNQPLVIDDISFNSEFFSVNGSTSFLIAPASNQVVSIRFHSVIKGTYQKEMSIFSNDPDEPIVSVSLHAVAFAVNELHCGSLISYSEQPDTLRLSINNMEEFTGFQFDLAVPSPLTYVPGSVFLSERKTDHVAYADMISANTLRVVAFSLTNSYFSGNDGDIISVVFNVFGTGGWYPLNLSNVVITNPSLTNIMSAFYNGSLQVAAPDIHAATSLAFGQVSVTDTSTQMLRVYNYGQIALNISHLQFTNPAFFSEQGFPLEILPGSFADVPVSFHHSQKGSQQGIMRIFSNDPDENPFNLALTANAFAPNYMIVKDTTAYSVDNISIDIWVDNHEPFVAFEFYLHLPPELTFNPDPAYTQLTSRAADHIFHSGIVGPGLLRAFAFSLSQSTFNGNSGAIARIGLNVNSQQSNISLPLNLSGVILVGTDLQNNVYSWENGFLHLITSAFPYEIYLEDLIITSETDTCFAALHNIYVSNFEVHEGGSALLSAGQSIHFHPQVMISSGAYLHAYIGSEEELCINERSVVASSAINDELIVQPVNSTFSNIFKIYPNPTASSFTLELLKADAEATITVSIFSMIGEKLMQTDLPAQSLYEFNLSNHPKGIYIIRVVTGYEMGVEKLIKH